MATENDTTTTIDLENQLYNSIMQLDAMLSVALTSNDFSMKDEKIRDNYLCACAEKIDAIRSTVTALIPSLAASLTY